jgi:hypothetical protein
MVFHWLRSLPPWLASVIVVTVCTFGLGLFIWIAIGEPLGGWLIFPWICGMILAIRVQTDPRN